MARTRSARARSPASVLDPPTAAPNEPTAVDPAPPSATSPLSPSAPLASPRRKKRPVEPKADRLGARKKARLSAIEVGGDRDRDEVGEAVQQRRGGGRAAQDGQGDEAERLSRVGKKVTLSDGQQDYTISASAPSLSSSRAADSDEELTLTRPPAACPLPWRDSKTREFNFDDYPDFRPNMSPECVPRPSRPRSSSCC